MVLYTSRKTFDAKWILYPSARTFRQVVGLVEFGIGYKFGELVQWREALVGENIG